MAEETGTPSPLLWIRQHASDLGVFVAQQTMMKKYRLFATRVSGRMGKSKGAVGTVASMLLAVEQGITDPVARVLNDPTASTLQN